MSVLTKPILTTMVLTACLNVEVDIYAIARHVPIDDFIVGKKVTMPLGTVYEAGAVRTGKAFYNQITLILHFEGLKVNVKVFRNGQCCITGVKDEKTAKRAVRELVTRLDRVQGMETATLHYDAILGLLLDDESFVYAESPVNGIYVKRGTVVPNKHDASVRTLYIFNRRTMYDAPSGFYFMKQYTDQPRTRRYLVWNNRCECIGSCIIMLPQSRTNLPAVYDVDGTDIVRVNACGREILGKRFLTVEGKNYTDGMDLDGKTVRVFYRVLARQNEGVPYDVDHIAFNVSNINMKCGLMASVAKGCLIDVQKCFAFLTSLGLNVVCDQNAYNAIKIIFFINQARDGICTCARRACSCVRTTIIMFTTGSILFKACRSKYHCDLLYSYMDRLLRKYHGHFISSDAHRQAMQASLDFLRALNE